MRRSRNAVKSSKKKKKKHEPLPPQKKRKAEKGKKQKMKGWLATKTFVEIHEKGVSNNARVSKSVEEINWQQSGKTLEIYSVKGIRGLRRKLNS